MAKLFLKIMLCALCSVAAEAITWPWSDLSTITGSGDDKNKILNDLNARVDRLKSSPDRLFQELSKRDKDGRTPLFYAVQYQDYELVKKMLAGKAAVEVYDSAKKSLLMYAVDDENDDSRIAALLLERGADPLYSYAEKNVSGMTALHYAVSKGNAAAVRLLVEHRADPDAFCMSTGKDEGQATPFLIACYLGNKEIITALLPRVGDVNNSYTNRMQKKIQMTALSLLVEKSGASDNYYNIIGTLLRKKANPNVAELYSGKTALHFAAQANNTKLYRLLRQFDADNNRPDDAGQTPVDLLAAHARNTVDKINLHYEENAKDSLSVLFEQLAAENINLRSSSEYKTALQIALANNDTDGAMKLLSLGADYSLKDSDDNTALDYALLNGQDEVVDYLLDRQVRVGDSLFTAIDAALDGKKNYVEAFLQDGVQPVQSKQDVAQDARLPLVVYTVLTRTELDETPRRIAMLQTLLEHGYDIDAAVQGGKDNGCTALCYAVRAANRKLAGWLLEHGADPSVTNKGELTGRTALFYALENKDSAMVSLLLEALAYSVKDVQLPNVKDRKATLLMFFAAYGSFADVKAVLGELLREEPYALSRKDSRGWTPFFYAVAYNGDFRVLKLLRMYGADVFATDSDAQTALSVAQDYGNVPEVLRRLQDYGL